MSKYLIFYCDNKENSLRSKFCEPIVFMVKNCLIVFMVKNHSFDNKENSQG